MKHYIIVKWNNLMTDKVGVIEDIKAIFSKTLSNKGIHDVKVLTNVVDRSNRYDVIIRIGMEKDSLAEYDQCEAHKEWKDKYYKYIESKAIFDSNE